MSVQDSLYTAILTIKLHIPYSNSLKSKRQTIHGLKDRLKARFNISISEINTDTWQTSTLGISMISNEMSHLDESLQKLMDLVEENSEIRICSHDLEYV